MPVDVNLIGFKEFIASNKPMCYNCKKIDCSGLDCNKCCEDQKDRDKYPNLNGPDYAFPNDFNQRMKYSKMFLENLSPVSLIV